MCIFKNQQKPPNINKQHKKNANTYNPPHFLAK